MRQEIDTHHKTVDGKPAGGRTSATGLEIKWQNGPLIVDGELQEPNGCFVETVVRAAIDRLEHYQDVHSACPENEHAIAKLQEAIHGMNHHTEERLARGVEGTYKP